MDHEGRVERSLGVGLWVGRGAHGVGTAGGMMPVVREPDVRFDMPKSVSFRWPSTPTITFSGFRSRKMTL